jgi:hypothetical protein
MSAVVEIEAWQYMICSWPVFLMKYKHILEAKKRITA